jgi:hypothetical protein
MSFNFSAINDERVGYKLKIYPGAESCDSGPFRIIPVTFSEVLNGRKAQTPQEAYNNLEQTVNRSRERHDLDVTKHTMLTGHIVACDVLGREAIMNAMNLIKTHYLEGKLPQKVKTKRRATSILMKTDDYGKRMEEIDTYRQHLQAQKAREHVPG